ncbi:hypothetical protein [Nocardioides sp.]|uniref:hypothetical protein n=1 Tax=Nocardioides sp. TaxID=35761 RepID=UPI0035289F92
MASVELWWLPLGAGGQCVRVNGLVFEAGSALLGRRTRCDLYHAGLTVSAPAGDYVIEVAPVWSGPAGSRGSVGEGPVGLRGLGRSRWFRYEVRCWRDGVIPDLEYAVASPVPLTREPDVANRVLGQVARVPRPTWGRDELGLGEMWNSNSVVSWTLATAGVDLGDVSPPAGGRAPGWDAGIGLALRSSRA